MKKEYTYYLGNSEQFKYTYDFNSLKELFIHLRKRLRLKDNTAFKKLKK